VQLLCFGLAARRYALDLASIERVVRAVALDRIPGLPPAIRGVFNLHGRLVPVGDMRHRLGLAAREIELDDRIVVTRAAGRLFGVVAEGGTEVVDCPDSAISDPGMLVAEPDMAAGLVQLQDELVLIQDLAKFLSADGWRALDATLDAQS